MSKGGSGGKGGGGGKGGPTKTLAELTAVVDEIEALVKTPVKGDLEDKIDLKYFPFPIRCRPIRMSVAKPKTI